jgi:hypothetical protein
MKKSRSSKERPEREAPSLPPEPRATAPARQRPAALADNFFPDNLRQTLFAETSSRR